MKDYLLKNKQRYLELSNYLFTNPELGFNEFKTKQRIITELKNINPEIKIIESNMTGFKTVLQNGTKNIAIVAELDAVYSPTHFQSDIKTGAAHNCGHFAQVVIGIMLYEYLFLNPQNQDVTYTFLFTPAEEYLDLEYRKQLLKENKITALSGKIDMILTDFVTEVDLFFSVHSMVDELYDFDLGTDLTAFTFFTLNLTGKAAHAGVEPQKGINALDYAVEIYQVMRDLEAKYTLENVRINPIITCDQVLNVVVEKATIESYIRVSNNSYALDFISQLRSYLASLENIKYDLIITPGYLEFNQDPQLVKIAKSAMSNQKVCESGLIFAGGDVGDFSYLAPTIQIGFGGFEGQIHGSEFKIRNEDVYVDHFEPIFQTLMDISKNINDLELYKRSKEQYIAYKNGADDEEK